MKANSAEFVPPSVMFEIVRSAVPALVTVTVEGPPDWPTRTLPNGTLEGLMVTTGAVPVPDSDTVCGLPVALSAIESVAACGPVVVGEKVTLIVVVVFGATVIGRVPAANENWFAFVPLIEMAEICRSAVPVFVTTIGLATLLVPETWLPKFSEVVDRLMPGTVPVPVKATECGLPAASSVIDSAADFAPGDVGANFTLMVVVVFGATCIGSGLAVSLNCAASVPVKPIAEIFRVAVPVLVITMPVGLLVVPTG